MVYLTAMYATSFFPVYIVFSNVFLFYYPAYNFVYLINHILNKINRIHIYI